MGDACSDFIQFITRSPSEIWQMKCDMCSMTTNYRQLSSQLLKGKEDVLSSEATTLLTLRARHGAGTHAEAASALT